MDIIVKVKEVKGTCPVYKVGQEFVLKDGFKLSSSREVCMHSLASILPYYNALRFASPDELGLEDGEEPGTACVQCLDPAACTGGGTVILHLCKME